MEALGEKAKQSGWVVSQVTVVEVLESISVPWNRPADIIALQVM